MIEAEDREALAAEYVLGTLDADEAAQADALVAGDPGFVRLVRGWERRLGELHAMVAPVEPPAHLWPRIAAQLAEMRAAETRPAETRPAEPVETHPAEVPAVETRPAETRPAEPDEKPAPPAPMVEPSVEPSAEPPRPQQGDGGNVVFIDRRLARWRMATAGFAAIAAALAAIVITSALAPERLPPQLRPKPQIVEVAMPAEPPGRFVAVLQRDATAPAFVLTVDVANRTLMVRRVAADAEAGKSYELWLVSDKFPAPRSLGVIGADAFTPRSTLADYDPPTISDATYAVSLEPEGGSPTGTPTGPVLFTGKLVEAVPGGQ